ncbi:MAG: hypothetical protein HY673_20910 [Chloroflexi bacterium]|nr:hypothetical protein [Chloroflexota bacterium]
MVRRISRVLLSCVLAILVVPTAVTPVLAADFRSGDLVVVPAGEVVNDDLYVAGRDLTIDGTVNGDLLAAGGTVTINGDVNGSLMVAGGTVNINGKVARAVRAAGGTLMVNGEIGGDLIVAGGTVTIAGAASIGKDLVLASGTAHAAGSVGRNLKGFGGDIVLAGSVKGNAELAADRLTLTPGADIQGGLVYTSENEADVRSGASVRGATVRKFPEGRDRRPLSDAGNKLLHFLMAMAVGIMIIFIAPGRLQAAADSIRTKPWPALGWGALALLATPIAAVMVMATIIGIPLALIGIAFWLMALYLSQIPVGLIAGRTILRRFGKPQTKASLVVALACGLAVLGILSAAPVLGFLIVLGTVLFGLGAIVQLRKATT